MRIPGVIARRSATLLTALGVTLTTTIGALTPTPAPEVPDLPAIATHTLQVRYDENRAYIEATATMAEDSGASGRAVALRAMAAHNRRFLTFDGRGDGRAVEVIGDLERAEHIAIVVPGSDISLDTFDGSPAQPHAAVGGAARALYEQTHESGAPARVAVIAWLGYDAPDTTSLAILTTGRAEDGADELRAFVSELQRATDARVALLCHSYGSVVCGRAAPNLEVADIAVYGSPGMGTDSAASLRTEARLWAARGSRDWIGLVPNSSISVLGVTVGFGADPTDPAFGASRLEAEDGGHSDYLAPGSPLLHSLALIASGEAAGVTDA